MRTRVLLSCLVAAALGVGSASIFAAFRGSEEPPRETSGDYRDVEREVRFNIFEGSSPLGNAPEVSVDEAERILKSCSSCSFPSEGAAGKESVAHVWARLDGKVAYDFQDELRVYFTPDIRTNDDYVAATMKDFDGINRYSVVDVRGGQAIARTESDDAPAALLWIADGYLIEMIGHGGQSLSDLLVASEGLGAA